MVKQPDNIVLQKQDKQLLVSVSGNWSIQEPSYDYQTVLDSIHPPFEHVRFESQHLENWGTKLLAFVLSVADRCRRENITLDESGLPAGVQQLLQLAREVPEREGAARGGAKIHWVTRIGERTLDAWFQTHGAFRFITNCLQCFGRLVIGQAKFRLQDLLDVLRETGPSALPIVSLISALVGIIFAFVGAIQLRQFGAEIYVADLVGIAMVREMGPMMTGIIMAGRTGAAFAAQIGTMQVNEEIDAFKSFGFSAMDFLVLPRMLALILMMPLLCIYADIVGILGGLLIGVSSMGLTLTEYWNETVKAVDFFDITLGLLKALIFGIVIAVTGCMYGMQSGRSASSVGNAATSAVVTSIVMIVVIDGIFAVITSLLGI